MKHFLVIIFLTISANLFAQNDSIKIRNIYLNAYKIDSLNKKAAKISTIKFDSINVKIKYFNDKVETENFFINSNTTLSIIFYSENSKLSFARIIEKCKTMGDLANTSEYYFEHNKIFSERYYHGVRGCMAIPFGKSIYELYGYNKYLNDEFLKSYVIKLYDKIKKNYR